MDYRLTHQDIYIYMCSRFKGMLYTTSSTSEVSRSGGHWVPQPNAPSAFSRRYWVNWGYSCNWQIVGQRREIESRQVPKLSENVQQLSKNCLKLQSPPTPYTYSPEKRKPQIRWERTWGIGYDNELDRFTRTKVQN